jgi:hypothetical protein
VEEAQMEIQEIIIEEDLRDISDKLWAKKMDILMYGEETDVWFDET